MRATTNESVMSREIIAGDSWGWKNPWKHIFCVFQVSMFLVLVAGMFGQQGGVASEASEVLYSPNLTMQGEVEQSFCLEGAVMTQLLQGFGSERLADEISGYMLNCGARILREEIVGNQAILDVEIDCECVDPDGERVGPMQVKGQWNLSFDL